MGDKENKMGLHFIVRCHRCNKIIRQCRCTTKDKYVTYELCEECEKEKKKKNEEFKEDDWKVAM